MVKDIERSMVQFSSLKVMINHKKNRKNPNPEDVDEHWFLSRQIRDASVSNCQREGININLDRMVKKGYLEKREIKYKGSNNRIFGKQFYKPRSDIVGIKKIYATFYAKKSISFLLKSDYWREYEQVLLDPFLKHLDINYGEMLSSGCTNKYSLMAILHIYCVHTKRWEEVIETIKKKLPSMAIDMNAFILCLEFAGNLFSCFDANITAKQRDQQISFMAGSFLAMQGEISKPYTKPMWKLMESMYNDLSDHKKEKFSKKLRRIEQK